MSILTKLSCELPPELTQYMGLFFNDISYWSITQVNHALRNAFLDEKRILPFSTALRNVNHLLKKATPEQVPALCYEVMNSIMELKMTPAQHSSFMLCMVRHSRLFSWTWTNYPAIEMFFYEHEIMCQTARCNIKSIEFLHSVGFDISEVADVIVNTGNYDNIAWILENGPPPTLAMLARIAYYGHLDLLELAMKSCSGRINWELLAIKALEGRHQSVVDWVLARYNFVSLEIYEIALAYGSKKTAQMLFEESGQRTVVTPLGNCATVALGSGNIEMVEYLMGRGYQYNASSAARELAARGHVDGLRWMAERGERFDRVALKKAASRDRVDALEFLLQHVERIDYQFIEQIAIPGSLPVFLAIYNRLGNDPKFRVEMAAARLVELVEAFKDGMPVGRGLCRACWWTGRCDLLEQLIGGGYSWDEDFVEDIELMKKDLKSHDVGAQARHKVVQWAIQHRCPKWWVLEAVIH